MGGKILCIGFSVLLTGINAAATAASDDLVEKAKRDKIARVPIGDADMEAAFRKARATLDDFLTLVRTPRPSIVNYAVKIGIPDRDQREYFWISRFTQEEGRLIGKIDNTPRLVRNVREGERITFKKSDVVDWLYRENGKMLGNFTACALIKHDPPRQAEAFKKEYGLTCDQ